MEARINSYILHFLILQVYFGTSHLISFPSSSESFPLLALESCLIRLYINPLKSDVQLCVMCVFKCSPIPWVSIHGFYQLLIGL